MQVNEPQQVLASTQPCVQVHSPTSAHAHDESSGYEGLGEVVHATAAIGIVSIVISIPIAAVAAKALLCRWLSSPVAAVRGWSIILASVSVSAWARSSVRLQIFIKRALFAVKLHQVPASSRPDSTGFHRRHTQHYKDPERTSHRQVVWTSCLFCPPACRTGLLSSLCSF